MTRNVMDGAHLDRSIVVDVGWGHSVVMPFSHEAMEAALYIATNVYEREYDNEAKGYRYKAQSIGIKVVDRAEVLPAKVAEEAVDAGPKLSIVN